MLLQGPGFFFEPALFAGHVARHAARFTSAAPFAHAVMDDFLPAPLADALAAAFPAPSHPHWKRVDHAEQAGRLGHLQRADFEGVDPLVRHTLDQLNGAVFLRFLEQLSGLRGLIAEHGTSWMLTRLVGHSRALDLMFSSRRVDGDEAYRIGLADRVCASCIGGSWIRFSRREKESRRQRERV